MPSTAWQAIAAAFLCVELVSASAGSPVSLSSGILCSDILSRYGASDARVFKDFGDFTKKTGFYTAPFEGLWDASKDYEGSTSVGYTFITRARASFMFGGNFSTATEYHLHALSMCYMDVSNGGGAGPYETLLLDFSEGWNKFSYNVPSTLLTTSLFSRGSESDHASEARSAKRVTPYYDDSYRRVANIVTDSLLSGGLKKEPRCSGGLGLLSFLCILGISLRSFTVFCGLTAAFYVAKVSATGVRMLASRATPKRVVLLFFIAYCFSNVEAVTCYTCFDQCPGCAGGDQCPFLTRTTANRAILSGATLAAGAATTVSLLNLLPIRFLRVLTRQVLDSLRTVARRPAAGTPVDLTTMSASDLVTAIQTGTATIDAGMREVLDRIGAATTAAEVTKLSALQSTLTNAAKTGATLGDVGVLSESGVLLGAYTYAFAQAGRIARSTSISVATAGTVSLGESSKSDSVVQEKILRPTSELECCNFLSIWQMICHATGLADVLVTGTFLQDVFFNLITHQGRDWQLALELVLVYLDALETSTDASTTIGNIYHKGSQDTYLNGAMRRVQDLYPKTRQGGQGIFREQEPKDVIPGGGIKFNGAWNTKATTKCYSFNLGNKDHPARCLNANGSCKYLHACDQWVTDKGPKGQCGGNHPRTKCNNPNKCDDAVAA